MRPLASASHQRASCNVSVFWRIFSCDTHPPSYTLIITLLQEGILLGIRGMLGVDAPALIATPRCCPVHEALHLIAVFPHQVEELAGVQASRFRPEKGLEPPAQVWTFPRIQAITAGHDPVVAKHLPHLTLRIQGPYSGLGTPVLPPNG